MGPNGLDFCIKIQAGALRPELDYERTRGLGAVIKKVNPLARSDDRNVGQAALHLDIFVLKAAREFLGGPICRAYDQSFKSLHAVHG